MVELRVADNSRTDRAINYLHMHVQFDPKFPYLCDFSSFLEPVSSYEGHWDFIIFKRINKDWRFEYQ